MLFVELTHTAR